MHLSGFGLEVIDELLEKDTMKKLFISMPKVSMRKSKNKDVFSAEL